MLNIILNNKRKIALGVLLIIAITQGKNILIYAGVLIFLFCFEGTDLFRELYHDAYRKLNSFHRVELDGIPFTKEEYEEIVGRERLTKNGVLPEIEDILLKDKEVQKNLSRLRDNKLKAEFIEMHFKQERIYQQLMENYKNEKYSDAIMSEEDTLTWCLFNDKYDPAYDAGNTIRNKIEKLFYRNKAFNAVFEIDYDRNKSRPKNKQRIERGSDNRPSEKECEILSTNQSDPLDNYRID